MKYSIGTGSAEAAMSRTWIDIDLDRILQNYRNACALTAAKVMAVIKSNAYGLGAERVAEALTEAGCTSFAVACAREGLALRQAGITGEIFILGVTPAEELPAALRASLTLTVASLDALNETQEAAKAMGVTAQVHLKANTGMHRLGFDALEAPEATADTLAALLPTLDRVRVCGLYSHLGLVTPERDTVQYEALRHLEGLLRARGIDPGEIHICDSISLVRYPEWHADRVRIGAMLFGVKPFDRGNKLDCDCQTPFVFRTRVTQVTDVPAGSVIGYGAEPGTDRPMRVATLAAGYGDGYPRHFSRGKGRVYLRGGYAPVLSVICMDQLMVDVTDIPGVQPGDEVELLGGHIDLTDASDRAGTNRIELITIFSRRPPRVYRSGGGIVTVTDDLLGVRTDFPRS